MQFQGQELLAILRKQSTPVAIVDFSGRACMHATGREAADRIALIDFVGVGNHGRIRHVKPRGVRFRRDPFGLPSQVAANFRDSARIPQDAEMNRVLIGAKTWPQQPCRAKTGHGGSVTTFHFRN